MSVYCREWRGLHRWETPLYNRELGNTQVLQRCRCGDTRTTIRYIPMQDTEEYEDWNRQEDDEGEEDEGGPFTVAIAFRFIAFMVFMLVFLSLISSLLPLFSVAFKCVLAAGNMTGGC